MKLGKISESILKRSVLKQIKFKREEVKNGARVGGDCAIFSDSNSKYATSIHQQFLLDSVDIKIAIHKAVNNIAVQGFEPFGIMISLIIPEKYREIKLKEYMEQAQLLCSELKIEIMGGNTTVSNKVTITNVVITSYGKKGIDTSYNSNTVKIGDDIVVSKWIGLEGSAIIAREKKEELLLRYPSHLIEEACSFNKYISIIPEAATAIKSGVCAMHDISEGGIFGALWEIAESTGVGLHIDLKKIPIRQETVEVCEFCNVNPYELLSGGSLIMITEDGENLIEELRKENISANIIGKITDSHDRILMNDDEKRYLDKPKPDEIHRIV